MRRIRVFALVWLHIGLVFLSGLQAKNIDEKKGYVMVEVESLDREVYQKISERLHQLKGIEAITFKANTIGIHFDKELGCAMKIESALKDMGIVYKMVELHNPNCKCKHCETQCSGRCKFYEMNGSPHPLEKEDSHIH